MWIALIQRVSEAGCNGRGEVTGAIGQGLLVLLWGGSRGMTRPRPTSCCTR